MDTGPFWRTLSHWRKRGAPTYRAAVHPLGRVEQCSRRALVVFSRSSHGI
jgi:hypothetical protein